MISKQKGTFYRERANITCSLPYWQKYDAASGKGQILAVICLITRGICPCLLILPAFLTRRK